MVVERTKGIKLIKAKASSIVFFLSSFSFYLSLSSIWALDGTDTQEVKKKTKTCAARFKRIVSMDYNRFRTGPPA